VACVPSALVNLGQATHTAGTQSSIVAIPVYLLTDSLQLQAGHPLQAHVNFVSWAPRSILETLAAGAVKAAPKCTIAKVFDQHLNFIALEGNLFTLALSDSYILLNDNTASEEQVLARIVVTRRLL
jgi:hypothetical protein